MVGQRPSGLLVQHSMKCWRLVGALQGCSSHQKDDSGTLLFGSAQRDNSFAECCHSRLHLYVRKIVWKKVIMEDNKAGTPVCRHSTMAAIALMNELGLRGSGKTFIANFRNHLDVGTRSLARAGTKVRSERRVHPRAFCPGQIHASQARNRGISARVPSIEPTRSSKWSIGDVFRWAHSKS